METQLPSPLKHMRLIARDMHIAPVLQELEQHPELWNRYRDRTSGEYTDVHSGVSDIWVRYADGGLLEGIGPHQSVWYEAATHLPCVVELAFRLAYMVRATSIGGVLITRIPAGGEVKPHCDTGWHAEHYKKVAVQLAAHPEQAFHYEDGSLVTLSGDVFVFQNQAKHWVTNPSPVDRITMIVCYDDR